MASEQCLKVCRCLHIREERTDLPGRESSPSPPPTFQGSEGNFTLE